MGNWGTNTRKRLVAEIGTIWECRYCGIEWHYSKMQIEHVKPRSRGGPDVIDNIVIACKPCNLLKCHRTPEEFLAYLREKRRTYIAISRYYRHIIQHTLKTEPNIGGRRKS